MEREDPTNPSITISHDELLSYLVGACQRIEAQLATDPPWVAKLFDGILDLTCRVEKLEKEVSRIKTVCSYRHDNGKNLLGND
jgi:hypothetical protein